MQAVPVGQHRVDEGLRDVDAAPARLEHPLDELVHLRRGEDGVGELVAAGPGDEDPARIVDPYLLDLGVVEVALQRAEAGDPGHELLDRRVGVGERQDRAGQRVLVVVGHDPGGQAPDRGGVTLRVEGITAYRGAQALVELVDVPVVRAGVGKAHGPLPPFPRELGARRVGVPFRAVCPKRGTLRNPRNPVLWTTRDWREARCR